jgi:glycosyltransferase involved in cell wall biosynthesis
MTQETKPLVTIVTITFNLIKSGREKTFRQCVESVHAQAYENIEHIIVDGASVDGTVNLIKEYADKNWIRYISEPDTGIYDAMNKGIRLAKGKYIAFLNSDDYYHDNSGIEESIRALEESRADFSYAPVVNLQEASGERQTIYPEISKVFYSIVPNHQTMFTKREILINEGMFDTNYRCVADYDMTVRLCLKKYKSKLVRHAFTTYRLGGFSMESTKDGSVFREAANIYYNNYGKIISISREECEKLSNNIYHGDIANVSPKLANALKGIEPYFDFKEYAKNRNIIVTAIRKKINPEKYFHAIFNGKFRKTFRKIYYGIRFKKIP